MMTADAPAPAAPAQSISPPPEANADHVPDATEKVPARNTRGLMGQLSEMTPEVEVLLLSARLHPPPEAVARLAELLGGARGPLQWNTLLAYAERQAVLALLCYAMRRVAALQPHVVPQDVLSYLNARFLLGAAHNMQLTGELVALLDLLRERGIPAIPYKGPVVAQAAYGTLALRPFYDLDILVHARDLERVHRLLVARGYEKEFHATHDEAEYAYKYVAEFATVEVHWDVLPRHYASPLNIEEMWGRLRPLHFVGRDVLAPSPEDLMLLLCLHGYKHRWNRLEWIACLAELARKEESLNWERLLRRATRTGGRRMLFLGLQLARELVGAQLPDFVVRAIDKERGVPLLVQASRQALSLAIFESEGGAEFTEGEGWSFFHLKARERLRDKARYLAGFAVTPGQFDWRTWLRPRDDERDNQ